MKNNTKTESNHNNTAAPTRKLDTLLFFLMVIKKQREFNLELKKRDTGAAVACRCGGVLASNLSYSACKTNEQKS